MAEEVLWVHLVTRTGNAYGWGSGATLRVIDLTERDGIGMLEVEKEEARAGAGLTVVLQISQYTIRSLNWKSADRSTAASSNFEETAEDQAEALDIIREYVREKKEQVLPTFKWGPVRVEIEFVLENVPDVVRRGVVTGCLPPGGQFKDHSVSVREWREDTLSGVITSINEEKHRVLAVHKVAGTATSADLSLRIPQDVTPEVSFERLASVWKEFTPAHRGYASDWQPGKGASTLSTHGQSHFYSQGYSYKPEPALFRRAGDESGVKNFQEQEVQTHQGKQLWGLEGVALPPQTEKSDPPATTTYPTHCYGAEYD